jgi:hypothetical protein
LVPQLSGTKVRGEVKHLLGRGDSAFGRATSDEMVKVVAEVELEEAVADELTRGHAVVVGGAFGEYMEDDDKQFVRVLFLGLRWHKQLELGLPVGVETSVNEIVFVGIDGDVADDLIGRGVHSKLLHGCGRCGLVGDTELQLAQKPYLGP